MNKIIDKLYVGDISGASNMLALKRAGITHILTAAAGIQPFFPRDFKYKCLNVLDMPQANIGRFFPQAVDFIKEGIERGGGVLVHCFAGRSRSVSCAMAYLMQERQMSCENAYKLIRSRRAIAFPNFGFQQ